MEDLLFLAHRLPYPPNKGDKIRSYHMLRHLSGSYRIHLGTFVDDERDWEYVNAVKELCASVCVRSLAPARARVRSLGGLLSGEALTLPYYRDRQLQKWIDSRLSTGHIRRAFVFSSAMAQYLAGGNADGLRLVVDFVDVDSEKWRQYAAGRPWPLSWVYRREARRLLSFERSVAESAHAGLFVSPEEATLFRHKAPESAAHTIHVENGVDVEYFSPDGAYPNPYPRDAQVAVFTGAMDYWPNADAVDWFVRKVFPQVRRKCPSARFYIVGARPGGDVRRLAEHDGVVVTGLVPDIRPYLAHAQVSVAPLRVARGIQNKVLEAMAMGTPAVVSRAAAEGLALSAVRGVNVADSEADFARLAIMALSAESGTTPASATRDWVMSRYRWSERLAPLCALLEDRARPAASCGAPAGAVSADGA